MMHRVNLIAGKLILVILIGVMLIAACTSKDEKVNGVVNLNTARMIEADDSILDSTMGPALISAYLCKVKGELKDDSIPYADVYVCKSFKRDSVLGDTVIILDTRLRKEISGEPNIYSTGIQKAKKRETCKVAIPPAQLSKIRKYRYKYAQVTLITDD